MNNLRFPKIGLRNLKTALSVFICIVLFNIFGDHSPFYACIAAVICMKDTIDSSLTMGKDRLIGTFIGGLFGIIFVYILEFLPTLSHPNALVTAIGVIIVIYVCNLIKKPGSVAICCVVFIGIMLSYTGSETYEYAITRTIDTAIGVVIAILINMLLPFHNENNEEKDCPKDNPIS